MYIEEGRERQVMSYLRQWTQLIRLHGRGIAPVQPFSSGCTGTPPRTCSLISWVLLAQIWSQQPPCHSLYVTYYFMGTYLLPSEADTRKAISSSHLWKFNKTWISSYLVLKFTCSHFFKDVAWKGTLAWDFLCKVTPQNILFLRRYSRKKVLSPIIGKLNIDTWIIPKRRVDSWKKPEFKNLMLLSL